MQVSTLSYSPDVCFSVHESVHHLSYKVANERQQRVSLSAPGIQAMSVLFREVLTSLGPSFVKAGQVLASRPDIVREDYMNELCTLQDDVPSFPDDQVEYAKDLLLLS